VQEWLDGVLFRNSLREWITTLGWALGATGAIVLARAIALRRLAAIAQRTATRADDAIVEVVRSVRKLYVLLIAVGVALRTLDWPIAVYPWLRWGVAIVFVLQGLRTGNRLVAFWVATYAARHAGLDQTTQNALSIAARAAVWVTVILIAIDAAGGETRVRTILTGLGISGIAIALAVQNILGDLFAALSIVLDKPFVVGDYIAVDQIEGTVSHVGLKSTRVRSVNGEEVIFANADLLKSRLRNLTRRESRRFVIALTISPHAFPEKLARVPQLIGEVVARDGRATLQHAHVMEVGHAGVSVEAAILIPNPAPLHGLDVRQAILVEVLARLRNEGIALATPQVAAVLTPPGA